MRRARESAGQFAHAGRSRSAFAKNVPYQYAESIAACGKVRAFAAITITKSGLIGPGSFRKSNKPGMRKYKNVKQKNKRNGTAPKQNAKLNSWRLGIKFLVC